MDSRQRQPNKTWQYSEIGFSLLDQPATSLTEPMAVMPRALEVMMIPKFFQRHDLASLVTEPTSPARRGQPRVWVGLLAVVPLMALTPLLVWSAWWWGVLGGEARLTGDRYQVHGSSMVPTLMGTAHWGQCRRCRVAWAMEHSPGGPSSPGCVHCGEPLQLTHRQSPADVIRVEPLSALSCPLAIGDCVAIYLHDGLHVKRIAAVAGDRVDVDGVHLVVNDQRLDDLLAADSQPQSANAVTGPMIPVDWDARREISRWHPLTTSEEPDAEIQPGWQRTDRGRWEWHGDGFSPWLVYHPISVHAHDLPGAVWDDYAFNVSLSRRLFPVDRLMVGGQWKALAEGASIDPNATTVQVALWLSAGNVLATARADDGQPFRLDWQHGQPAEDLPVDEQQPVAIRVDRPGVLNELTLWRAIQYRLRPSDDRDPYPITVADGELFVVGDNVPVSVDSRQWGPISVNAVSGIVVEVDRHTAAWRLLP